MGMSLCGGGEESGHRDEYEILEWNLHRNPALTPTEATVLKSFFGFSFPFSLWLPGGSEQDF